MPNNSLEPTRPAAATRVHASVEALGGRLISRPLGALLPSRLTPFPRRIARARQNRRQRLPRTPWSGPLALLCAERQVLRTEARHDLACRLVGAFADPRCSRHPP